MHDAFMQLAITSAREGVELNHGGPFGACVVRNGEVIAIAHNTVLRDHDPSCHAEMNAVRAACKTLGTHILADCEIYTTAEPCPMCLAAIYWSRLREIVVGVPRDVAASFGFDDAVFYSELAKEPEMRSVPSSYGVLEADCQDVFKEWQSLNRQLY